MPDGNFVISSDRSQGFDGPFGDFIEQFFKPGQSYPVEKDPNDYEVVWANYPSYFTSDPETARADIRSAIKSGPQGLGAFFAAKADQHFQFVRRVREKGNGDYCYKLSTSDTPLYKNIPGLYSGNKFQLVTFTNDNGSWHEVAKDISGEEAFAFILTDNRFRQNSFNIFQAEAPEMSTTMLCNDIRGATSDFKNINEGEQIYHAIASTLNNNEPLKMELADAFLRGGLFYRHPIDGKDRPAGLPLGTISAKGSAVIRTAIEDATSEFEGKYDAFYKRFEDIYSEYLRLSGASEKYNMVMEILYANRLGYTGPLSIYDAFPKELFEIAERIQGWVRYDCKNNDSQCKKLNELSYDLKSSVYSFRDFAPKENDKEYWLWRGKKFLDRQPAGPIKILSAYYEKPCQMVSGPNENKWIEGEEIIALTEAFYGVVLPSIEDQAEREDLKNKFEAALKKVGDLTGTPLAILDEATSKKIRTIIGRMANKLGEDLPKLYQRLFNSLNTINAIPSPKGYDQMFSGPSGNSPLELKAFVDGLIRHLQNKIPRSGVPQNVLEFLERELLPLRDEVYAWKEHYDVVQATWQNLLKSNDGVITLMALGGVKGRGGYLPQIDSVVVSLPTTPKENGVELDLGRLGMNDRPVDSELLRDWDVVIKQWDLEGKFAIGQPKEISTTNSATLKFGKKNVPVRIAGKATTAKELTKILQEAVDNIKVHPDFGPAYLAALAGRGISDIVIAPQSYLDAISAAEASALAKRGKELFPTDPKKAILLLKRAATKFASKTNGYYLEGQKRIILSRELLEDPSALTMTLLHEIAHSDERIRKDSMRLAPDVLEQINDVQYNFIVSDNETVSKHSDVANLSINAPEERRADGLVYYWTNTAFLKQKDPDLYNYFVALNRTYETKNVVQGEDDEETTVIYDRLRIPAKPFDPSSGNLVLWTALRPDLQDAMFSCLAKSGDENNWLESWYPSCQMLVK